MTDEDSSSYSVQPSDVGHYKAIIAIGLLGSADDVSRFTALWVADSERRAHRINERLFRGRLTLLPLPEVDVEIPK